MEERPGMCVAPAQIHCSTPGGGRGALHIETHEAKEHSIIEVKRYKESLMVSLYLLWFSLS